MSKLFELNFFTEDEMRELVHFFIPTITLEQAKKAKLLNDTEITKTKNEYVDDLIKDNSVLRDGLSDTTRKKREEFIKNLSNSEVIISTKG
jgi:hypothetical protein